MTRTDTPVHVDPAQARKGCHRLVASMASSGVLVSSAWRRAVERTPRHPFVPRFWRQVSTPARRVSDTSEQPTLWERVDGHNPADQEAWLDAVYDADQTLVTQLNGSDEEWDRPEGRVAGWPTSSSSLPKLVVGMLEDLDVTDGMRVLEVGTGTGYNAALLCARLGDEQVTTIDVDRGIVNRARTRLADCEHHPTVALADGLEGYLPAAPYDRIIATCSPVLIPRSWLRQTRPGGKILVSPLHRRLPEGVQVRLTVHADHGASGYFVREYRSFMAMLRAPQRQVPADRPHRLGDHDVRRALEGRSPDITARAATRLDTLDDPDFRLYVALHLPGLRSHWIRWVDLDRMERWLLDDDGSWAHLHKDEEPTVEQGGPRRLWHELDHLLERWQALGSPRHDRFGMTVTPDDRHTVWLDTPDSEHTWSLEG